MIDFLTQELPLLQGVPIWAGLGVVLAVLIIIIAASGCKCKRKKAKNNAQKENSFEAVKAGEEAEQQKLCQTAQTEDTQPETVETEYLQSQIIADIQEHEKESEPVAEQAQDVEQPKTAITAEEKKTEKPKAATAKNGKKKRLSPQENTKLI